MKKSIIAITVLISLIVPLSAFSWVGNIDATAKFLGEQDDYSLEQTDRATLSVKAPFNTEVPMSFSASAFYEFGYVAPISDFSKAELTHVVDLSSLKLNVQVPLEGTAAFSLDIGRFEIGDLTTLIFDQPSDGVRASFANEMMQLSSYVGFTGFLNAYTVNINTDEQIATLSDIYTLTAPFVLANVALQLPQLFANQDLFAEVFAAINTNTKTESDNRLYTTLGINGPISSSVYYTITSTLGLSQKAANAWELSNLSVFELAAFLPFASTILSSKTVFATGGEDNTFNTFTVNTANLDDSLEYAGHVKTGLVATIRPIDNLLIFIEPNAFFNVMNTATDKGYTGFQYLVAARLAITSDLQLMISGGQYYPADTSLLKPYTTADVKLSFVF